MELIILAAGTGSRLWPLTEHVPKSLLDLGDGRCMLERQIESARAAGAIEHVSVVVGYRAAQVEARIRQMEVGDFVGTIFNPVFKQTNNLLSLWFALPLMRRGDFVVSNGDNIYKKDVLPRAAALGDGIWLTIDRKPEYDDDDMKVTLQEDGTVGLVSKGIAADAAHAESVGLAIVRGERYRKIFAAQVDALVREEAGLGQFWLETFNAMARHGHMVRTLEIPAGSWVEVDFHPDVKRLRQSILGKLDWQD
jgi:choline kinase